MASRDIETVLNSALTDAEISVYFAVELMFEEGALRVWTGVGTQTLGGNSYTGVGELLGISNVDETSEIAARGASLVLNGVPSDILTLALTSPYQGRVAKIHFGVYDGTSYSTPTEIFSGYMDEMNIDEGPETSTIELLIENKLIELERPRVRRYSSSFQKSLYPTDKGFDLVEAIQDREVSWGEK